MGLFPFHPLRSNRFQPSSNQITENETSYTIELDAVGVAPDNISVNATENELHISAEATSLAHDLTLIHREHLSTGLNQKFRFRNSIDADHIEAELHNGLLSLKVPKKEARRIAVTVNKIQALEVNETHETALEV